MKIQDTTDTSTTSQPSTGLRGKSRLATLGAIIVVLLIIAGSVFVFTQLRPHPASPGQGVGTGTPTSPGTPAPTAGQWVQVLNGYTIVSLAAAPSDPSVLYACAITSHVQNPLQQLTPLPSQSTTTNYALLRSTDFGSHWQDIGSKANTQFVGTCQFAIDSANSNDVYVVSTQGNASTATYMLQHTTDGGQTWNTVTPALNVPGSSTTLVWQVQQLSREGNHLFGLQSILTAVSPTPRSTLPKTPLVFSLAHLVTSVDGGKTWTVLDSQLKTTNQGVRSYAVDASDTNTIYELIGGRVGPLETGVQSVPGAGVNGDLYKTTDNGATWHLLLQGLPYGTQVQLAHGKSQIVYVGGSQSILPYTAQPNETIPQPVKGFFQLRVSGDGGMTWQDVPEAGQQLLVRGWFVSADGLSYIYSSGTLAATPQPGETVLNVVRRYDPTTKAWSDVTKAPTIGFLLNITASSANGGAVLWFVGTDKSAGLLYRYVA